MKADLLKKTMPEYFEALTRRLERNSFDEKKRAYIVGRYMTIADIDNIAFVYSWIRNDLFSFASDMGKVLKKFKKLGKYYDGLAEEFDSYLKHRPKCCY